MSTLLELSHIRENLGLAPVGSLVYLGIGFTPPKLNAIRIDPDRLPTDRECHAVAGLDVVLLFRGHEVRYSTMRSLTDALYRSCPRRLQLVDLDYKRVAFLKLAGL
jgi:hypothetical protein